MELLLHICKLNHLCHCHVRTAVKQQTPHDKRSSTTVLPDDHLVQLEIKVQNICLIDSWYLPCIDAIPKNEQRYIPAADG